MASLRSGNVIAPLLAIPKCSRELFIFCIPQSSIHTTLPVRDVHYRLQVQRVNHARHATRRFRFLDRCSLRWSPGIHRRNILHSDETGVFDQFWQRFGHHLRIRILVFWGLCCFEAIPDLRPGPWTIQQTCSLHSMFSFSRCLFLHFLRPNVRRCRRGRG